MRHLGIIVPMPAEATSLARKVIATSEVISPAEGIKIQLSGVGAQRAKRAARNLLEHGATALLSWGTAGALAPGISPGSLVIPRLVICPEGSYPTDPAWHECLLSRLKGHPDLYQNPLAEAMTVLKTSTEKTSLFKQTGAVAADMESGAVADVAQKARVPFMVIRAVVDAAETPIPKTFLNAVDEFGQVNLPRLIRGLARRPFELLSLVRLGRNFRAAQATLATVAPLVANHFLVPQ